MSPIVPLFGIFLTPVFFYVVRSLTGGPKATTLAALGDAKVGPLAVNGEAVAARSCAPGWSFADL